MADKKIREPKASEVAAVIAKLRSLNNACVCSVDNPCNACLDRIEAIHTLEKQQWLT